MRLPWWPCYVDARVDERGVYFDDDGTEKYVPWPLVGSQGEIVVAYEENGKRLRKGNKRVILKISKESRKKIAGLQKEYLSNPELELTCGVDQAAFSIKYPAVLLFFVFYLLALPSFALIAMTRSLMSAPDNEPGVRYQNVLVATIILIACLMMFFCWRTYQSIAHTRRAHKVASINNLGVLANNSNGQQSHYNWDQMNSVQEGFIGILVTTDTDEQLLFPLQSQAWKLARQLCNPKPAQFRTGFIITILSMAVLTGPIFSVWHTYLVPDHEIPSHLPWGVSALSTGMLLSLFSLYPIANLLEKRRAKKSE